MGMIIAIAGKGGTGKTTTVALLINILRKLNKGSVLAIDADPNSNLGDVLGVQTTQSIGTILDEIAANPDAVPAGMTKDRYIEYKVQHAVVEGEGFDLLTMGKPEGPGCYCYVNNVLRNLMSHLIDDYAFVIIDNEAGLEHLSRRTTRRADVLLVVSDATVVGLKAAGRISALVKDLKIEVGRKCLLLNRLEGELPAARVKSMGLELLGALPYDKELNRMSIEGTSLLTVNDTSAAFVALRTAGDTLWQK